VATVVEAHQGNVECLEEPGGGARFRISLPRAEGLAGEPEPRAVAPLAAGEEAAE